MTLLPVVLLSSPLVTRARAGRGAAAGAGASSFRSLMVAASPVIAIVIHRDGVPDYASHYRLIARAVDARLAQAYRRPLRIVGSYATIVNGIVFYFEDPPSTLDIITPAQTPWVDDDRIKRDGIVIVCPVPETKCVNAMNGYAARYPDAKIEDGHAGAALFRRARHSRCAIRS